MKKSTVALVTFAVLLIATAVSAETYKNVPLVDGHCAEKVAKDSDSHKTSCAIQCAKAGYGILDADGNFIRFDKNGSEKALAALKATEKEDHLRANVEGEMKDGVLVVSSLELVE